MAGQTLTLFDEALKIDYLPLLREQLDNEVLLLQKVEANYEAVSGKQWQLTTHYQRNSGVGNRADGGTLPTAGQQKYKNPYGTVKYLYGRMKLTGPTIAASRNRKGAIVSALSSEMKGLKDDIKFEANYQLHNDGTGVRALVNTDPGTGTTLTLDQAESPGAYGTRYMYDGMKIDIVDPSGGAIRTGSEGLTVTRVDSETAVTMSASLNAAVEDNDEVLLYANHDGAGTSYEMMGLKGIIDDGTYAASLHNINRTSFPWFKSTTFTNDDGGGTLRDLDMDLMQDAIYAVKKYGNPNFILGDDEMFKAYGALLTPDKRYAGNTLKLDGGFTALECDGIPFVLDYYMRPKTIFFVDTSHLSLPAMSDWSWMDKDAAILSRVSGEDAYEAVLYRYFDLASDKPRSMAFLRDIKA